MNKKITIFILISLLIFTGCGCRKKQDNNENNTPKVNEEVLKEKQVKELKIKNISMELTDNNTTTVFTIELENTSEKDVYIKTFNIYFKDKDGKNILNDSEYIPTEYDSSIKAGETQSLSLVINQNLENTYSVDYELVN